MRLVFGVQGRTISGLGAFDQRLAKTSSKSVHPFGWNFVHKQSWIDRQIHTHTHTHTHTHRGKTALKYNPFTVSWRCSEIKFDEKYDATQTNMKTTTDN